MNSRNVEHARAVEEEVQQQQRAEKVEIGVANQRQHERHAGLVVDDHPIFFAQILLFVQ